MRKKRINIRFNVSDNLIRGTHPPLFVIEIEFSKTLRYATIFLYVIFIGIFYHSYNTLFKSHTVHKAFKGFKILLVNISI